MNTVEIFSQTVRHFLGPIMPLMDDENVTEVMVIGPETVYYEESGRVHKSELRFPSEALLMAAVQNIAEYVNRPIDDTHHSMDARLPDGSRVHVIIPPSSRRGICLTIRKFKQSTFNLAALIEWGSLTAEAAEFLELAVVLHKNIVISGGLEPARHRFSMRSRQKFPRRSGLLSSKTAQSFNSTNRIRSTWKPSRPVLMVMAKSRFATCLSIRCACGPIESSSVKCVAVRLWI